MQHIAIMNNRLALINDILSGKKTIESRWYKAKRAPWGRIAKGERVYFKKSGGAVEAVAEVERVEQYQLNEEVIKKIINDYGGEGMINLRNKNHHDEFYKAKNYCVLVFLKNPIRIKSFNVDKKGFGNACAWMSVDDIERIKVATG